MKHWWKKASLYVRIVIALVIALLVGSIPEKNLGGPTCRAGCGPNDRYCTSLCCLGTVVIQNVTGCTKVGPYCNIKYSSIFSVSCPSPGCSYTHYDYKCSSSCAMVSDIRVTGCCLAGPAPTDPPAPTSPPPPTATFTLIPTKTATPTATATFTPSSTPIPLAPSIALTAQRSSLLLMATRLGLPVQTLNMTITNGAPSFTLTIRVTAPGGVVTIYTRTTAGVPYSFGAVESGDANFGTTMIGTWSASVTGTDSLLRSATSNTITWTVNWYPVHQTP